jgi:hypothetical protein
MKYDFSNIGEQEINLYEDEDLSLSKVFITINKSIPNEKDVICNLNIEKIANFIETEFDLKTKPNQIRQFVNINKINKKYFDENILKRNLTQKKFIRYIFILKEGLMISLNKNKYRILYDSRISQNELFDLERKIINFIKPKKEKKKHFYMIVFEYNSLNLRKFKTKKHEIDINLNYNDDFGDFDKSVKKFLNSENKSGIILMHGISGSGKTSYIRYLINSLNYKFIFLPLFMAESLTNPEFLPFLSEHKNSILIIEDAEKLIKSRESENTANGIATLLNMSDGLLSDALGIKMICTFNTELEKIDKALLRKGRMINRYEFKELSIEKAATIAKMNNLNYNSKAPISLGDLYNIGEENTTNNPDKKQIGFLK